MSAGFNELIMELRAIQKARSVAQVEAMREYDKSVYKPAWQSVQLRCAELGHQFSTSYHLNPFGYSWRSCLVCGERTDVTAPPEQHELDEIKPVGEYPIKLPNRNT